LLLYILCICKHFFSRQEHGGSLNEAVNAYFSEGDRNLMARYAFFHALEASDHLEMYLVIVVLHCIINIFNLPIHLCFSDIDGRPLMTALPPFPKEISWI